MKERPILFSAPMVRALLDGTKTQTRRVVKVKCQEIGERDDGSRWPWSEHPDRDGDYWHCCPYGTPGDRLWVRETFCLDDNGYEEWPIFRADGVELPTRPASRKPARWTPSIHMPRWSSRILLEIVSVRVERLQDISAIDCHAEGIDQCDGLGSNSEILDLARRMGTFTDESLRYATLWEQINGAGSWDSNPWVWVVEFRRVTP